ncbi:hypothetical protein [Ruminococcus sp. HUN007]|uniref:hypothetical protein n=1 Tax=Ruminococcus sp. HUN007 TaxID=1514668 RepID=UPI0005D191F7|nr:hypothetical protein [Ruminococcus sp. HUN007]
MGEQNKDRTVLKTVMKILIVLAIIIAAGLLSVHIWFRFFRKPVPVQPAEDVIRNHVVTDASFDRSVLENADTENTESFDVKMNRDWTFSEGSLPSADAYVENPVSNVNDVYFDIILNGTEQVIYTSPVIPVGGHLENIALEKDLAAGKYSTVLKYHMLGKDGKKVIGELQMALNISVLS